MSKRLEFFQVAYRNHPSTIHREKKRPALAEFVCLEIYSTCELQMKSKYTKPNNRKPKMFLSERKQTLVLIIQGFTTRLIVH